MKVIIMSNEQKVTRKLRAIFSADVKGYSILMANDEVSTIQTLKGHRNIMSTCIEQGSGRIVDAVGDNLLAEFDSAVDAVQCAVEVQKGLRDKNQELPEDKKMEFRIGINIADVIEDGDRIFGDGVNVASRLEPLASSNQIMVSAPIHRNIKNKSGIKSTFIEEKKLKTLLSDYKAQSLLVTQKDAVKMQDFKLPISEMKLKLEIKETIFTQVVEYIKGYPQ